MSQYKLQPAIYLEINSSRWRFCIENALILPPLGAASNSSDRNSSLPFPPAGGVEFSTAAL
ncbi:MAG: hypothetical protein ABI262_02930 [Microcoleus sp.]|jgi:hypothetical protein